MYLTKADISFFAASSSNHKKYNIIPRIPTKLLSYKYLDSYQLRAIPLLNLSRLPPKNAPYIAVDEKPFFTENPTSILFLYDVFVDSVFEHITS